MSSDKRITNPIFSERLKNLMKEYGYTQTKLIDCINKKYGYNLSVKTISFWFNGKAIPTKKYIDSICSCFHVTEAYLMGKTDIRLPFDDWNKRISPDSVNNIKKIETLISYLNSTGVSVKYFTQPIEQPIVKDVLIDDKQSYSVEYSCDDLSIEYFDFENDELIEKIERSIKNLIFNKSDKNKGESENGQKHDCYFHKENFRK